jgi:NAD-dependent SIR2 family protein deacetylase
MDEDPVLQNFRDAVRKSQHIVVVAGAGLSAASGRCSCHGETTKTLKVDRIPWQEYQPLGMAGASGEL